MMRGTLQAKKESGLGELFKGYTPQQLEEKKGVIVAGEHSIAKLVAIYQEALSCHFYDVYPGYDAETYDLTKITSFLATKKIDSYILKPEEIGIFLQASLLCETDPWCSGVRGTLTSALIQNSYNAGFNNFVFHWDEDIPLRNLGALLEGKEGDPIIINASGNIGMRLGNGANYVDICVESPQVVDYAGGTIKNSSITIIGDVQNAFFKAEDSTLDIRGHLRITAMELLYDAQRCTIVLGKNISHSVPYGVSMIRECIFKTSDQDALEWLVERMPCDSYSKNKVYFVEEDGTLRLEKAWRR